MCVCVRPFVNTFKRTAWFVSDLVGNPEDRFSCVEAQMKGSGNGAPGL